MLTIAADHGKREANQEAQKSPLTKGSSPHSEN
jgi:hypothetical protein